MSTQSKIGWRPYVNPYVSPSTLWSSIYSVWNADTLGTSLDTSIFRAYNGENATMTPTQLSTNIFGVWNGETLGTSLDTSIHRVYNGDNVNDTSGNAQNGTNVGSVTFTTGKVGNAFTFNGSNYIQLPNNSLNSLTGDFSFSLWMNRKAAVQANILTNYYNGATPFGWWLSINNGTLVFRMGNGTSTLLCNITTALLGANVWQLITITKSSSSVKMYVDGVLKTSATITGNVVYTTTHYPIIGAAKYDSSSPAGFLENGCQIDAVTIWQKELTAGEVVNLYNSGNGAEYPFSTQTLDSLNDAVGSNHGTRPASTLTGGVPGPSFTTGKIGKAFTFDGINDYIQLPNDSLNSLTGDFSISFWVNYSSLTSGQGIFSDYTYNGTNHWGIGIITNGNSLLFRVGNGTSTVYDLNILGGQGMATNTWYHYTITRKANTGSKIYRNEALLVSDTNTINPVYNSGNIRPAIGAWNYGPLYSNLVQYYMSNGSKIDGLTIWNKELSTDEIMALYNSGNGQQYPFSSLTLSNSMLDSVNSINGTNVGSVTLTTGKVGNAFTFTSAVAGGLSNQYISLPSDGSLNFTGDFSVSAWVYIPSSTSGSDYFYIVSNMGCDSWFTNPVGWRFMLSGNNVVFSIFNHTNTYYSLQAGYQFIPVTGVSPGVWAHLAFSRKGSTGSKIYINGNLVASDANTVNPDYSTAAGTIFPTIGNLYMGVGGSKQNYYYPRGGTKIDAVTIWNKELTANEVFNLYNDGSGAEYPFSTQTLASLKDSVGSNDGTRPASTLTNGVPGPSFTTGKIGKAFTFDGINDYVQLPTDSLNSLTSDFSVSGWWYLQSGNDQGIISNLKSSGSNIWGWVIYYNSNLLSFEFYNGGTSSSKAYRINLQSTTYANTWVNFTCIHKASTGTKIYINGTEISGTYVNVGTSSNNPSYTTGMIPDIGAYYYNNIHQGFVKNNTKLDAIAIWNKELSASEITELYNSGNGKQYPN